MFDYVRFFLANLGNDIGLKAIFGIILMGLGFIFISIFIPRGRKLHRIDIKRILNNDNTKMSDKIEYFHSLTKESILKYFDIDEKSKKYKDYQEKINFLGGLSGCTPNIIYVSKWLFLILSLILIFILVFVVFLINPLTQFKNIILLIFVPIIAFFLPDLWLMSNVNKRKKQFLDELDDIELFVVVYLKAGYNIYDLLLELKEITIYSKQYITECINGYYINSERALQNWADKIKLEEYQLLIDILKQAIKISDKEIVNFVESHMEQLKKTKHIKKEIENKKRPLKYAFILGLPLISVIILWFYPLLVDALSVFTQLGTF